MAKPRSWRDAARRGGGDGCFGPGFRIDQDVAPRAGGQQGDRLPGAVLPDPVSQKGAIVAAPPPVVEQDVPGPHA
jgi:hypothetical protein